MMKLWLIVLIGFLFSMSNAEVAKKTACQEHRDRQLKEKSTSTNPLSVGSLIPECDERGDYKPKQCFPPSKNKKQFCSCYTPDGDIVHSPSTRIEACECAVQRFAAEKLNAPGTFTPSCEADGSFSKKQCHGSTGLCWCADHTGKVLGEKKRGGVTCT